MKKLIVLAVVLFAALAHAQDQTCTQVPQCSNTQTVYTSGTAIQVRSNGGLILTFSFTVSGSLSANSIPVQGCTANKTCTTLGTYTSTSNGAVTYIAASAYSYYQITPTFTASVPGASIGINTTMTTGNQGSPPSSTFPLCSTINAGAPSSGTCQVPTSVLTAAAFAASNNTTAQIDVIPAQGSNRVIDVIDAICEKTAGTAFGTGSAGNLTLGYDNGNNTSTDISNVQGGGFLDQTAIIDASLGGTGTSVVMGQVVQNLGNLAVSVYNSTGAITAGSALYCTINYRIHTNQ